MSENVFVVKLSTDQRTYLNTLLPKGYSFQITSSSVSTKNTNKKNFQNVLKEESIIAPVPELYNKRRKPKFVEVGVYIDKKPVVLTKKDYMTKRYTIVKKLKKHESSWPFRTPVNPKLLLIPNYTSIVLIPMDLQAIEDRIKNYKYEHPAEIERDITQMFLNSYKFNSKDSYYFDATSKLEYYYHSLLQDNDDVNLKKYLPERNKKKEEHQVSHSHYNYKSNQISYFQKDLNSLLKRANYLANQKPVRQKPIYVSSKNEGPLTLKYKRELTSYIKSLDESHLSRIISIIKQTSKQGHFDLKLDPKTDVISLDLEKLDSRILRELQNYVKLQKNSFSHHTEESFMESQEQAYSVC